MTQLTKQNSPESGTEQVYNTPKTNNNNETFPKNYYGISKLIADDDS